MNTITAERLKELGLKRAGDKLQTKQDIKKKCAIAYEFYRVASPDIIKAFNRRLQERTKKIIYACPKCRGKGKEDLFFSESKETLEIMKKEARKSNINASECSYCQRTGAQKMVYDKLRFTDLENYENIPPEACLAQLEIANKRGCFDYYEVADVETVEVRPDPIIFGRIKNCPDRFFVTQWDTDVDINDILGA